MSTRTEALRRLRRDERGQLVVMFAIATITLLLFLSLTINVGHMIVRRHQAQVLADTGALTGAAVQARGLNQMTRLNDLTLRTFNIFQIRSRVGGYRSMRLPLYGTINQILAHSFVPNVLRTFIRKFLNLAFWPTKLALGLRGLEPPVKPIDEPQAFYNMARTFSGFRGVIKGLNYYWEYQARTEARRVTLNNARSLGLDGPGFMMRPVFAPGFGMLIQPTQWNRAKSIFNGIKQVKGTQDLTGFLFNNGEDVVRFGSGLVGFRPLVPEFENPDGDPLIVQYWTDYKEEDRWIAAGALTTNICALAVAPTAVTLIGYFIARKACVLAWVKTVEGLTDKEGLLRAASAPAWHDMRVTLHRKEGEQFDTHFLFWVRLPPVEPAAQLFHEFPQLPAVYGVAAAKPVGGNFGTQPKADVLPTGWSPGNFVGVILSGLGMFASKLLPEVEHLVGEGWVDTRKSKNCAPSGTNNGTYKYCNETVDNVYKDSLKETGWGERRGWDFLGSFAPRVSNLYWYYASHFPFYEPRLVPVHPRYLLSSGLELQYLRDMGLANTAADTLALWYLYRE